MEYRRYVCTTVWIPTLSMVRVAHLIPYAVVAKGCADGGWVSVPRKRINEIQNQLINYECFQRQTKSQH